MRVYPTIVAAGCLVLVASTPQLRTPLNPETTRVPSTLSLAGTEPPVAIVTTGDPAPDVTWEGPGSRPQRLRDLRAQGHVLLVISPTDAQLVALERERDRLLDLRIVPAAVLDRGAGATAGLARRLGLHFTLIPDPRSIVAAQFNALDPATGRAAPAWLVVDRWGRIRALDHTRVPDAGYARLASNALMLAPPGATLPTSAH